MLLALLGMLAVLVILTMLGGVLAVLAVLALLSMRVVQATCVRMASMTILLLMMPVPAIELIIEFVSLVEFFECEDHNKQDDQVYKNVYDPHGGEPVPNLLPSWEIVPLNPHANVK